jgi:hypothetical protein
LRAFEPASEIPSIARDLLTRLGGEGRGYFIL